MAKMLKSESRKFADRPVELLVHEDVAAPLTCGVLQPVIIMPRESMAWSESEL